MLSHNDFPNVNSGFLKLLKEKCIIMSLVLICIFKMQNSGYAQSCANYTVTRATNISYNSIASTGTPFAAWRTISGALVYDDNRSTKTDIGFDFWYLGTRYTQFCISTNGFIDFSNSNSAGTGTGAYGYANTQYSAANGTRLALAAIYDDFTTQNANVLLEASMKYAVSGTAPNRVLTVEWINMAVYLNVSPFLCFQIKLYETSGRIEYVYGTMTPGTAIYSYSCGINDLSGSTAATALKTQQTHNTSTCSNTAQNALATIPAASSQITFTPPAPSASPSGLSFTSVSKTGMTLNWSNNSSNELGYVIYNSTDSSNWTFVTQAAANAITYAATGLLPSTTYYWRVHAVTEGDLGTALAGTQATLAAGPIVSIATGNWGTTSTWDCTCVPTAGDNVTIANGHTVTLNTNGIANSLTVGQGTSGQLTIGSDATVRTLTIGGNVAVSAGATMTIGATAATHLMTVGDNFTNSGTLNLAPTSTRVCNVTFNKNGNQTISGSGGTTNFNRITLNMGLSSANVLEVTSTNFTIGNPNFLTLTNGTFKLSTPTASLTPFTAATTIPATSGIWLNNASATLSTTGGSITLYGYIKLSSGTFNIGNASDQNLTSYGATIIIDGGSMNIAGRLDRAGLGVLTYFYMSAGTLTVSTYGSTTAAFAPFMITEMGSNFTMTGGTIVIQRPGASNLGFTNTGGTYGTVTGGTLQIGNASTPASQTFQINSSISIYNLAVSSGVAVTAQLATNSLPIVNNLTINSGTLNANALNLTVGGNWTNSGTFTASTGTVTFSGTTSQAIAGSSVTTFNNFTLNNSAGVTITTSPIVSGLLTFTNGNITTGLSNVAISSTGSVLRTSGHVVGNFQKYIATGATSKTFEIGDATNYTPASVAFGSVTIAGNLTAFTTASDHANIAASLINSTKSVNRSWTFTNSGISFTNYSATYNFVSGDIDAGASTSSFIVQKYTAAAWSSPGVGTLTSTSTQCTGLTAFGDFVVGESCTPVITSQPSAQSICSGSSASLSVTATGNSLTYQWRKDGINLSNTGAITGVTTATLLINPSVIGDAGSYNVVITASGGCSSTSNMAALTINSIPSVYAPGTNVGCYGASTGSITVTPNGGSAPYSYLWSNSSTSQNLSLLSAATYTVTVTDANNCTVSTATAITQPASVLSASESNADVLCYGASTGSITLTPTGGTAPYTYLWSNSSTSQNLSSLSAATYTATVTDANNCTVSTATAITQPASALSASESNVDVLCYGENTGSITLTPTGGTAPYTYLWSNGSTSQNLSSLGAATYNVTVTDANNCTTSTSVVIAEPSSALGASESHVDVLCYGANSGTITLTPSGGTSPFTYLWSNSSTSQNQSTLSAATYTVTVSDANNCTTSTSVVIVEPSSALGASESDVDVLCYGASTGSITVTPTGGTVPYTYLWSNSSTSQNLSSLSAATYTVTVTDANNCTTSASVVIAEPTSALGASESNVDVLCYGANTGSVTLTPTGGTAPYTYLWSNSSNSQNLTSLSAATYTVTITDANSCTTSASATISEPSSVTPTITSSVNTCTGTSNGSADAGVTGGISPYTYLWSNSSTSASITSLTPGNYTITVTDANNCSNSTTVNIAALTAPAQPNAVTITGATQSVCPPVNGVVLSTNNDASATSYAWTLGPSTNGITFVTTSTTNTQTINIGSTSNTTYVIHVVASNSCGSSPYRPVPFRRAASVPASIYGSVVACGSSVQTYACNPVIGADAYKWTSSVVGTLINGNSIPFTTADTSVQITFPSGFVSGTISVASIVACNTSAYKTLSVSKVSPPITAISGTSAICANSSETYTATPVVSATSYAWTLPLNATGNSTTNSINVNFGNYTSTSSICVKATNACGVQTALKCLSLPIGLPGTPSTISGSTSQVCIGSSQTYSVNAVPNTSYMWTPPANATISSGQGTNSVTISFNSGFTSGSISVRSSNTCGLSNSARSLLIQSLPATPGTITGQVKEVCANSSQNYSVIAVTGVTYLWTAPPNAIITSGQGTNNVTVTFNSGFVSGNLKVKAVGNCGNSADRSILINSVLTAPLAILGSTNNNCSTTSIYKINKVNAALSYSWSTNISGAVISANSVPNDTAASIAFPAFTTGNIYVTANNVCGSSAARLLTVKGTPATVVSIVGNINVCVGDTETYSITAIAGAVSYTWAKPSGSVIISGQGTTTIDVLIGSISGNISVSGVNACGTASGKAIAISVTNCRVSQNNINNPPTLQSMVFKGYTAEEKNILMWITENKPDVKYFSIESSVDTITFSALSTIEKGSTESSLNTYSFVDYKPEGQLTYYRIKLTDAEGRYLYSQTIEVENKFEKLPLKISPNPNNGFFLLTYNGNEGEKLDVEITNAIGETIHKVSFYVLEKVFTRTINLGSVPVGIYYLRLRNDSKKQYTKKLSINN